MTPVFVNKLFVNQAQPERIQYVMVDRNSETRRAHGAMATNGSWTSSRQTRAQCSASI